MSTCAVHEAIVNIVEKWHVKWTGNEQEYQGPVSTVGIHPIYDWCWVSADDGLHCVGVATDGQ